MSDSFDFHLPTRIKVGADLLNFVGLLTREITTGENAFVVTDPGVINAGLTDEVIATLQEKGFRVIYLTRFNPAPRIKTVKPAGLKRAGWRRLCAGFCQGDSSVVGA